MWTHSNRKPIIPGVFASKKSTHEQHDHDRATIRFESSSQQVVTEIQNKMFLKFLNSENYVEKD